MKAHFVIIGLAFLGVVWLILPADKTVHSNLRTIKHPQEYMKDIALWSYTPEGNLKNELQAQYWAYLPETQYSKLTKPHLIVHKPDGSRWTIDAEQGRVLQPTIGAVEEVELSDHVVVERPGTASIVPIKLETSVIRYQPKKEYAETDQYITMTKPNIKITGIGMRAFIDKSFVELLQDVKTHYIAHH